MFASRSLLAHLTRGIIGLAALALSVVFGTSQPWLLLVSLPVALIALRGCPMCWTIGLVATVVAKFGGAPPTRRLQRRALPQVTQIVPMCVAHCSCGP